jgi:PKD domain-containing protein
MNGRIRKKHHFIVIFLALLVNVSAMAQLSQPIKVWDQRYGGSSRDTDVNTIRTSDNGFLITGSSLSGISGNKVTSNQGNDDWWVLKLDSQGGILWDFNFGGTAEDGFEAGATETSDGNFVLAGRTRSGNSGDITSTSKGRNDILIVKISGDGSGVLWQKRVGGNSEDVAYDVIETSNGNVVVGGYSSSTNLLGNPSRGSLDAYMIMLDPTGNIVWEKTFGGSGFESLDQLRPDNNGGIIAAGYSASTDLTTANNGSFDYWLFNIDENGNQVWENTYGGSGVDAIRSMALTPDGGILIGGQSNSGIGGDKTQSNQGLDDMWLVKTNAEGELQWEKTYGGIGYDWAQSIYALTDGSFVFGGFSNSGISGDRQRENIGNLDVWFLKADAKGALLWQGVFGGNEADGEVNIPYYDEQKDEIYLSGSTNSGIGHYLTTENFGSGSDFWLAKFQLKGIKKDTVEICINTQAKIKVEKSLVGRSYQLKDENGDDNGLAVDGNGSKITLLSDSIPAETNLGVYVTSSLPDNSVLEEYLGQVHVQFDQSLDEALNSEIQFESDVCYDRHAKISIDNSVKGVTYQLVDESGKVLGEKKGNGKRIQIKTKKLKESIVLRLKLKNKDCMAYHAEEILITVSPKITAFIQYDDQNLSTEDPIDFSTGSDEDIVSWTWTFEHKKKLEGEHVSYQFKKQGDHEVKLVVENSNGCKKTIKKKIRIRDQVFISAPGIFRPRSHQGHFKVKLKNTKHETLKILDLNEGVIYSGKNSWNGTKRGKLVRQGWYIYYIQAKLKDGTTYQKRDRFYLKH